APVVFRHWPADRRELRAVFQLRHNKSFLFIGLNTDYHTLADNLSSFPEGNTKVKFCKMQRFNSLNRLLLP
ncbi:hypothetical protein, partial [Lelliottia amnigena]